MARVLTPSGGVFLDTAYAVALASATDAYHHQALAVADELEANGIYLANTWGVLIHL